MKVIGVFVCGSTCELLERLYSYEINYFELVMKGSLKKHAIEVIRENIECTSIPINFIINGKKVMGVKGFLSYLRKVSNEIDFPIEVKRIKTIENENELIPTVISFLIQYHYIYIHLSDLSDKPILIMIDEKDTEIMDYISRYEVHISYTDIYQLERKLKGIIDKFTATIT